MSGTDVNQHGSCYSIPFRTASFHCRKQPSARVLQLSLSLAVLDHVVHCGSTVSSLHKASDDLPPFVICHSVLLMIHLLPFIRVVCPARLIEKSQKLLQYFDVFGDYKLDCQENERGAD